MNTPKLTRDQAAIISAYTGIMCGPFEDMHAYVDGLPGFKGIGTISFASKEVTEQIKDAAKKDFLALCPDRSPDPQINSGEVLVNAEKLRNFMLDFVDSDVLNERYKQLTGRDWPS